MSIEHQNICSTMTLKNYKPNDVIVHQDDPGDSFFYILTGTVNIKLNITIDTGIKGENQMVTVEKSIGVLKAGQTFGELSLLYGTPRSATIVSVTNSALIKIDKEPFDKYVKNIFENQLQDQIEFLKICPVFHKIDKDLLNKILFPLQNYTNKDEIRRIAASIGLIVGNLFKLGVGIQVLEADKEIREISSVIDTLRGLLPSNIVSSMAEGNIVAVVIFAAFIGNAIKRLNKKYRDLIKPFVDLVEASYKIIVSISITIIKMMPYAVIALMANTIAENGLESMFGVLNFIIALYVSVMIMFIVHLMIISFNGLNPITYIKNVSKALILAFTSRSSLGTLPVTIESLTENAGVESGTASFVGSLGANMGLNGCAGIYPALMIVTIANMAGVTMDFSFYAMSLIVITISSLGIAGLPGTATMAVSVVLSGLGLGSYFQLAGGILAIDPILDMGRTMLNVNGTMTSAITVASSLKKIDKNIFSGEILEKQVS